MVASAVQSGADGYLNKAELTPGRLMSTVKDVMESPLEEENERLKVDLKQARVAQDQAQGHLETAVSESAARAHADTVDPRPKREMRPLRRRR